MPRKASDRDLATAIFVYESRRARGITQARLAKLAGVGRQVICELECGKPTMRLDCINAVLGIFGKKLGVVDAPRSPRELHQRSG